jgi:hypothetical protein
VARGQVNQTIGGIVDLDLPLSAPLLRVDLRLWTLLFMAVACLEK